MRQRNRRILGENGSLIGETDFSNACISNVSFQAPWYGHIAGSGSTISPDNIDGLLVYEFKWSDTGEMFLRLGVAGDEKIFETDGVLVSDHTYHKIGLFIWSDVALQYRHIDIEWTDQLIADAMDFVCMKLVGQINPFNIVNGTNNILNGTDEVENPRR